MNSLQGGWYRGRGMKFYYTLLVVVMLGCATTQNPDQVFSSWIGKNLDDLIFEVGQPDRTFTLNDGSKVVEYIRTTKVQEKDWENTFANSAELARAAADPTYKEAAKLSEYKTITQTCTVRFKLNDNAIINNYAYSGQC